MYKLFFRHIGFPKGDDGRFALSQKLENQLNLALETPEDVRRQTRDLNVGYDLQEQTWELIIKYHGAPEELQSAMVRLSAGITLEPLIAGYAILTVPEGYVETVSRNPQIEYVEKPKNYYFVQEGPSARACIVSVTAREPFLSGEGVLMAVIDSGLAYQRREFRREDGSTRIRFFWDQTLEGGGELPGPPVGFFQGVEFNEAQINAALFSGTEAERRERMPTIDVSGHGTAVTGIAAASRIREYQGVAPKADLLIVKFGGDGALAGYSKTTEILRAVTYCIRKGQELGEPLVINLSFGNTYGAHDGSSLLERFLDNAAEIGRTVICVGSGNEGNSAGHVSGRLLTRRTVDLAVAGFERNLSVQLWKQYPDEFRIDLRAPGGSVVSLMPERLDASGGGYTLRVENVRILVYFGEPTPYSAAQEIYLEFLPIREGEYLSEGIWRFELEPVRIVTGEYAFYLPSAVTRNRGTGFLESSPDATLTIPSTAAKVITVGAYDVSFDAYADFSGRGFITQNSKPDLVAPGVNVLAPDLFGGYVSVTGTSFSVPIVSGSAALLMEWGIIRGNDPWLYGEKIKAYLQKGAQPIRGENRYPNEKVGYGAVCISDSLK